MSVLSVKEIPGRTGSVTKGVTSRSRRFIVKCSTKTEDENTIKQSFPAIMSPFFDSLSGASDQVCTLKRINPEQDKKNPLYWFVTLEYDTEIDLKTNDGDQGDDSPFARITVNYSTWQKSKAFNKKRNGDTILLSNGLPPNPPIERDVSYKQITITLFQKANTFTSAQHYSSLGKVNTNTWKGHGSNTLLIRDVTATQQFEKGLEYYEIVYTIAYLPGDWGLELLNIGTHKKDAAGNIVPIKVNDVDVKEPHLLTDTGVPTTTPSYTIAYIEQETDFATLPINLANVR
jgi:hypothetical protein